MRLQRSSELPKPESLVSDNVRESNNYVVDYSAYADYKRPSTSSGMTGLAANGGYDYSLNSRAGYGGGCFCGDQGGGDDGGLGGLLGGDLGLLAAGAGAVFLLYQQIITLMMRRRKRSSLTGSGGVTAVTKMGETSADQLSTDFEDILKGRIYFILFVSVESFQTMSYPALVLADFTAYSMNLDFALVYHEQVL